MNADSFSLDDKRSPIEANDIPDVIARFNNLAVDYPPTSEIMAELEELEREIGEEMANLKKC